MIVVVNFSGLLSKDLDRETCQLYFSRTFNSNATEAKGKKRYSDMTSATRRLFEEDVELRHLVQELEQATGKTIWDLN